MARYTFGKNEKLCSRPVIDRLFSEGKWMKEHPLQVGRLELDASDVPAKVLITAPKKRFRKAVSRNRVKRMVREAYRLNKEYLLESWEKEGKYFAIAFVYVGNELPVFKELENSMIKALHKLRTV